MKLFKMHQHIAVPFANEEDFSSHRGLGLVGSMHWHPFRVLRPGGTGSGGHRCARPPATRCDAFGIPRRPFKCASIYDSNRVPGSLLGCALRRIDSESANGPLSRRRRRGAPAPSPGRFRNAFVHQVTLSTHVRAVSIPKPVVYGALLQKPDRNHLHYRTATDVAPLQGAAAGGDGIRWSSLRSTIGYTLRCLRHPEASIQVCIDLRGAWFLP
jgi:hypothetical protein